MDWWLAPIDPARAHAVGAAVSWHGRSMVLAWGILAPLAVLIARFFKVMPGQDWPRVLDNPTWWRAHWMGQSLVLALTLFGLVLIWREAQSGSLHGTLGYAILVLCLIQVSLGIFRGTKGGPTAPARDGSFRGDHYDMTPWRRMFEAVHKSVGYMTLGLGIATVVLGLWLANGPRWMWLVLIVWWVGLAVVFVALQRRGWAADTYEAIWGTDPSHPGNRMGSRGWGMRRHVTVDQQEDSDHVRSH